MKIEVNRIAQGTGKIVAFCDVRIEIDKDLFFVEKGFRVVKSADGHFMGLPSDKRADMKNYATFLPSDALKADIEKVVFKSVLNYKPIEAEKLEEVSLDIHDKLHSGDEKILGKNVIFYRGGDVRAVEVMGYKYLTQNPNKRNKWANMAKEGHKVTWMKKGDKEWIARIVDGVFEKLTQ